MRILSILSIFCLFFITKQPIWGQSYYFKSLELDDRYMTTQKVITQTNEKPIITGKYLNLNSSKNIQYILQLNEMGEFLQCNDLPLDFTTLNTSICAANDGNFITTSDKLVNKVSPVGEVIWSKKNNINAFINEIIPIASGYVMSVCYNSANINSICNTILVKINESGQQLWKLVIAKDIVIYSLYEDPAGFLFVSGYKESFLHKKSGILSKIGPDGALLWTKNYTLFDDNLMQTITPSSDNGLFLTGLAQQEGGSRAGWITKVDKDGNVKWSKIYGNTDKDLWIFSATKSDGLVFAMNEPQGGAKLCKINESGLLLWAYEYSDGINPTTRLSHIIGTTNGILGVGNSFGSGPIKGFVLKTDKNGLIPDCCPKSYELTVNDVMPVAENLIEPVDFDVQWLDHVQLQETVTPTLTSLCIAPNLDFTLSKDTLCPGECLNIQFDNPTAGFQYSWFFRNGTPNISNLTKPDSPICFEQEGTIVLTATKDNCPKTASKTVVIQKPNDQIPNAFTPNGDGTNDTFKPFVLNCPLRDYHLQIFNRWGEQVYDSTEFTESWDGITPNGYEAPQDVYIWRVDYAEIKDGVKVSLTKNGDVTVLR
jgi:gliding motility-associated-like protein